MPNLMCNVTTCGHNKHNLCCKDGIQVGGSEAFVSETTCCESFIEKTKEFLNSTEEPKAAMPVNCEAVNCVYNELGMCGADSISIAGGPVSSVSMQHLQLVPVTVPLQIQDHIRQADLFFAVLRRTVIPGHHQADGTCIRLRRVGLAGQQLADGVYTRCSRRCFMPGIPSFRQPNGRQHCQQYQCLSRKAGIVRYCPRALELRNFLWLRKKSA